MKAVQISHVSDDLSGVALIDIPVSEAGPGQLKVRMSKAAVHPSDLNYIRGEYRDALERLIWNLNETQPTFDVTRKNPHPELPCIPGGEGVGIVESCGEGLDPDQWLGKRVALFAGPPNGAWQEYVVVFPQQVSPVPDALPDTQAALMMLNPLTALAMTKYVLGVGEGDWLLVSAGASAVSKIVAALGHHYGFKTISVVRNSNATDKAGPLTADVTIDLSSQDLREEVKRITDGQGVKFALDCVGGELAGAMVPCLTNGGRMLLYGTLSSPSMTLFSRDLMMPNAFIGGFYLPGWMAAQAPATLGEVMGELGKLSAAGLFQSDIEAEYPLSNAIDAVRASIQPGRIGKILLDCSAAN